MFRGFVGVEASLYDQEPGGAIVGIYDLNNLEAPAGVGLEGGIELGLHEPTRTDRSTLRSSQFALESSYGLSGGAVCG